MSDEENKRANDVERVKAQLEILKNVVFQESGLLPVFSSIALALIVVLSLGNILNLSETESKRLLSLFLIITLLSIWYLVFSLNEAKKSAQNIVNDLMGKNVFDEFYKKLSCQQVLFSYFPIAILVTLSGAIVYIIHAIWVE